MSSLRASLLVILLVSGLPSVSAGPDDEVPRHAGLVYDTRDGDDLPASRALARIREGRSRVICVGEEHTHPTHHRIQLDVIRAAHDPTRPFAIGLEMLGRDQQAALDRFHAGVIDLETLLVEVAWKKTWGYDFDLYREIFVWARANGVPIVGLNAPRDLVSRVGKEGVRGLAIAEWLALPEMDLDDTIHRARFLENVAGHGPMDRARTQRMYEAMTLWDEYMAESACRYLAGAGPEARIVVLAGNGHIAGRRGIPGRIERRTGRVPFVVVPRPMDLAGTDGTERSREEADYIWYTRPDPLSDTRVVRGLEIAGGSEGGGVWVVGRPPETFALDDLLVRVGSTEVREIAEAARLLEADPAFVVVLRDGRLVRIEWACGSRREF